MKTWKKITLGGLAAILLGGYLFLSNFQKKKQLEASERATGLISYVEDDTPKTKEDFIINEGNVQDFIESASWLYFNYDLPREALEMLNRAQKKAEKSWDYSKKPMGVIYDYKAQCFLNIEELDSAFTYAKKALKENKRIGWKRGLAENYHTLAKIYRSKKDFKKALTNYKKSEEKYLELGIDFFRPDLYNEIAKLYDENENIDKAIDYYENALIFSEKLKNYWAFGTAYKELIELYRRIGEKEKADSLNKKYNSLVKSLEKKGFKF